MNSARVVWLVVATALGCARAVPLTAKAAAPDERTKLRDEVREIARPHCGSCHQGSLPTAKPAALAVFDLERTDWPASMGPGQLRSFLGRIDGKLSNLNRPQVRAFLAAELATRESRKLCVSEVP